MADGKERAGHNMPVDFFEGDCPLFRGLPERVPVARCHPLAADPATLPDCFTVAAKTAATAMAVQHKEYPIFGVQSHPEPILTPEGKRMLENFINVWMLGYAPITGGTTL